MTTMPDPAGLRILVVGASTGIGRAVASAAAAGGASVAIAARRADVLEELAAASDGRMIALRCDLRDPTSCASVGEEAIGRLGGLDALVVAAGVAHLGGVAELDADTWRDLLEINVVGPALVTRAVLPELVRSHGTAVYCSSSAVARPWPGLVPYAASKGALEVLARGLQDEHPEVSFTTVVVGATDSGAVDHWEPAAAAERFRQWKRGGYTPGAELMDPDDVARRVLEVVMSPVRTPVLALHPRKA